MMVSDTHWSSSATAATEQTGPASTPISDQPSTASRRQAVRPVLETLFELYPKLFGADFLPLKLGIFQELLAKHPEHLERTSLKAALGVHTRSTPYLKSIAERKPRHDLQGDPVEPVAPEHVYQALIELARRRRGLSAEDLRPKLRKQLMLAFEASGMSRQDYLVRIQTHDVEANTLLDEAFAERDQALARQDALRSAFRNSGKTPAEFAAMYGLNPRDVSRAIERDR